MTERIFLEDGTQWVRPAIESDDEYGLGWKLRYAPGQMTRGDELTAAQIIDAYGYLLLDTTREQRDRTCRNVRSYMATETEGQGNG